MLKSIISNFKSIIGSGLIPAVVMLIPGIVECGDGPLSGTGQLCSLVKTDWNRTFKASAF